MHLRNELFEIRVEEDWIGTFFFESILTWPYWRCYAMGRMELYLFGDAICSTEFCTPLALSEHMGAERRPGDSRA